VELPYFPGKYRCALTTSWDDGTIHDRRLVAFMNEVGLKGTFNLNSSLLGRTCEGWHNYIGADEVAPLYAGHEVAIHSADHPWLDKLEPSQIVAELLDDRRALEDLVGYPVRGMAYPFGTYDARVLAALLALGIVYSRTVESRDNPWPAPEPLTWAATCHIFTTQPKPLNERFADWHGSWAPRLFYVWGHSYEFEDRKDWAALERLLKPLAGHADVWYCTNIELFDYDEARRRMIIAANRRTAYNPSARTVTLLVDGKPVDVAGGQMVRLDQP